MATSLEGGRSLAWHLVVCLTYLSSDSSVRKVSEVILIRTICKEDNVYLQRKKEKRNIDISLKYSNPGQPCIRSYQRNQVVFTRSIHTLENDLLINRFSRYFWRQDCMLIPIKAQLVSNPFCPPSVQKEATTKIPSHP